MGNENRNCTHVAYSDESHHNHGVHRALGVISLTLDNSTTLSEEIRKLNIDSDVTEVKWKKIDSAKYRFAAEKIVNACTEYARMSKLRVDVLIWNINDQRHKIIGRDDKKNLQNMYILALSQVIFRRWNSNATWKIFPDMNTIIDWDYLIKVINNPKRFTDQNKQSQDFGWVGQRYQQRILDITEVDSSESHLCQAIDLFTGLAVFSHDHRREYYEWVRQEVELKTGQQPLFPIDKIEFSGGIQDKCKVMNCLVDATRDKNVFDLQFLPNGGLITKNPSSPINFWFYESRSPNDHAPGKS